jgi:hypothetical protein
LTAEEKSFGRCRKSMGGSAVESAKHYYRLPLDRHMFSINDERRF